jgi:hypothetical protein
VLRRRKQALGRFQAAERGPLGRYRRSMETLPGQLARFPLASRYGEHLKLETARSLLQVGGGPELGRWLADLAGTQRFFAVHPSSVGRPDLVGWPGSLPFRDASFDSLFAPDLIRRLNEDEFWQFLAETARVTRPGGVVLLVDVPPVKSMAIERWHGLVVGGQRRGWASLLHLVAEMGAFSTAQLVDPGPSLWPPVPRIGVRLVRRP